jgi:hypothetical protein
MSEARNSLSSPIGVASVKPVVIQAMGVLQQAMAYSRDVCRDPWDFAVELTSLNALGLSLSDCRWLVCRGLVRHAAEIHNGAGNRREYAPEGDLSFGASSCLILTDLGAAFVEQLSVEPSPSPPTRRPSSPVDASPRFLPDLRELRYGEQLVKRFKQPSPNQEIILVAFQEEGWPARIDDPLPPARDQPPKRRLADTLKSLNRHQSNRLIHFSGDGRSEGILWESLLHR